MHIIYIYIYVQIDIWLYLYIYIYMYVGKMCVYIYIYTCIDAQIFACLLTRSYVRDCLEVTLLSRWWPVEAEAKIHLEAMQQL